LWIPMLRDSCSSFMTWNPLWMMGMHNWICICCYCCWGFDSL
jgi:hypothetical protein